MAPPRIAVVGSANMDLVARVDRVPRPGENVLGREFRTIPGGKGANQAVAAARLGATVGFFGKVGEDAFGRALLAGLDADGVDTSLVRTTRDAATGVAQILVNAQGENSIVICPGANALLTPDDIEWAAGHLRTYDLFLMQLEIPLPTVAHVVRRAREWGKAVVLDAGPPCPQPPAEVFDVDVLSPNEAEAAALLGRPIASLDDARGAARDLLERGARAVVLKMGARGALLAGASQCVHLPAHRVAVVDTTAAGDAFTAALAVFRAEGRSLTDAAALANRAGALAVTRLGAQPSMPTRRAVEEFAG